MNKSMSVILVVCIFFCVLECLLQEGMVWLIPVGIIISMIIYAIYSISKSQPKTFDEVKTEIRKDTNETKNIDISVPMDTVYENKYCMKGIENGYFLEKFIGFEEKCMTIPAQVNGWPVRIVGRDAFRGCSQIEQLIIPEGIIEIQEGAYSGCKKLSEVQFPSTLKRIGEFYKYDYGKRKEHESGGAFEQCGLREVVLPKDLDFVGNNSFSSCSQLKTVIFKGTHTKIGESCFWHSGLEQITFPSRLKKLNRSVCGSTKLKSVDIPCTVECIEAFAFDYCRSLHTIVFHEGLKEIKYRAFEKCSNLKSVTIPKSVLSIDKSSFDKSVVLYCYEGSYALTYARENKLQYKAADATQEAFVDDAYLKKRKAELEERLKKYRERHKNDDCN